jgi:hypothetical protein
MSKAALQKSGVSIPFINIQLFSPITPCLHFQENYLPLVSDFIRERNICYCLTGDTDSFRSD